jgi:MFS transporter, Spinster family, sphingosine-1-phosphate transporter
MRQFSPHQVRVLAILMLVNFINYIDRQIVFPLFPLIRGEFSLTYLQVGGLAAAFSIVHALTTLPLGVLADRTSRKKVIGFGLLFWSAATFLSGLAGSIRSLLLTRAAVGVGEAAYSPAATAIISGTFPRELRARVQGMFDIGMFLGGAMGLALGGIIGQAYGWRPAFFLVGVPGLLLGLVIFRIREPRVAREEKVPILSLLRIPAFVGVLVGGWFITYAGHAFIIWGPEFVRSYKGFSLREAGISLGALTIVAGMFGVTSGAVLADYMAKRVVWGRIAVVPIGFAISAPAAFCAFRAQGHFAVLALFFVGIFFGTWYHGPVTATIHDLTPAPAHATASGLYYSFVNLFATSTAPLLIGAIGDRYGLTAGMYTAVAAQVAGAICFAIVALLIARAHRKNPTMNRRLPVLLNQMANEEKVRGE